LTGSQGVANAASSEDDPHLMRLPHKCFPRFVSEVFVSIAKIVAWQPLTVCSAALFLAVGLSCGLLRAEFKTEMVDLYVPQRGKMAQERLYLGNAFGALPKPGVFVAHRKDSGNIVSRESLRGLFDLHNRTVSVSVSVSAGTEDVTFHSVCARRYVPYVGHQICLVMSPLALWEYSKAQFDSDDRFCQRLTEAWEGELVDVGGAKLTEAEKAKPAGQRCMTGEAIQLRYLFDPNAPQPVLDAWEAELFASIDEHNDASEGRGDALRVSYWSQQLSTREAKALVKKDGPLPGASMAFILVFVCVVLGGFTCDPRRSRVALGSSCALTTALSMSAGLGLASTIGIPFAPVSPLVCYTLLGVCVDDMIIITDAFDQAAHPKRSISQQLQHGMAFAGTAITVTSVTTFFAMLTGAVMDLPTISLFCIPAAICVVMVNVLQITLFCGFLVIDARRRQRGLNDISPCALLPGAPAAPAEPVAKAQLSLEQVQAQQAQYKLGLFLRDTYGSWVTRPWVRGASLALFFSLVAAATLALPMLRTGLPVQDTLPDDSMAREWFTAIQTYWGGSALMDVSLVLRSVDLVDASRIAAVTRLLSDVKALDFVSHVSRNWLEDYQRWCRCVDCAPLAVDATGSRPEDLAPDTRALSRASLDRFLADGDTYPNCDGGVGKGQGGGTNGTRGSGGPTWRRRRLTGEGGSPAALAAAAGSAARATTFLDYGPANMAALSTAPGHGGPAAPGFRRGRRRMSIVSFMRATMLSMRSSRASLLTSLVVGGKEYEQDIVLSQERLDGERDGVALVQAMRIPLVVRMPGDNDACYSEHVPLFDRALSNAGLHGFAYHPRYEFGYIDLRMPVMSLTNLCVAAVAIACSTSLFLPPVVSFTLVVIVGSIDLLLVGVLMLADLRLNAITFITLLVSLALAIDYSCHMGHAFEMANDATRTGKVRTALGSVGVSILNGGLSTLLGTAVLSVSKSNIFRTFFLMVWSTIVLALLAGMSVVPAMLCAFGPLAHPASLTPSSSRHQRTLGTGMRSKKSADPQQVGSCHSAQRAQRIHASGTLDALQKPCSVPAGTRHLQQPPGTSAGEDRGSGSAGEHAAVAAGAKRCAPAGALGQGAGAALGGGASAVSTGDFVLPIPPPNSAPPRSCEALLVGSQHRAASRSGQHEDAATPVDRGEAPTQRMSSRGSDPYACPCARPGSHQAHDAIANGQGMAGATPPRSQRGHVQASISDPTSRNASSVGGGPSNAAPSMY